MSAESRRHEVREADPSRELNDCVGRGEQVETSSHILIEPVYRERVANGDGNQSSVELPGEYPFTRGVQPTMYRGRLWTMRQYAGMGDADESNERYKYLLAHGTTGLSVAFDL